jgi:hypothetical protein
MKEYRRLFQTTARSRAGALRFDFAVGPKIQQRATMSVLTVMQREGIQDEESYYDVVASWHIDCTG